MACPPFDEPGAGRRRPLAVPVLAGPQLQVLCGALPSIVWMLLTPQPHLISRAVDDGLHADDRRTLPARVGVFLTVTVGNTMALMTCRTLVEAPGTDAPVASPPT